MGTAADTASGTRAPRQQEDTPALPAGRELGTPAPRLRAGRPGTSPYKAEGTVAGMPSDRAHRSAAWESGMRLGTPGRHLQEDTRPWEPGMPSGTPVSPEDTVAGTAPDKMPSVWDTVPDTRLDIPP